MITDEFSVTWPLISWKEAPTPIPTKLTAISAVIIMIHVPNIH